jgi:hypothetical protein
LVIAAVSVIAASNYLAYMIGRKQVSYEELRRQVDRIVQLVDQRRVEEELAVTSPKQQQEKLEHSGSALTDLTTSTINGKTTVEPASAAKPIAASLINDTAAPPPDREMRLQPPAPPLKAAPKHREAHGAVHPRAARRQKGSPTAIPNGDRAYAASAERSRQLTTATPATPDASLAGQ